MSVLGVSVDPEKVEARDELGEAEVSLRDTQFLGICWVLQEIH